MNPLSFIVRLFFSRTLEQRGPALTFVRLCTSRHLQDLQWVASAMLLLLLAAFAMVAHRVTLGQFQSSAIAGFVAAAAAGVLNWTYQAGSRRIGAVDLFACEISVICRVCLVVNFAQVWVDRASRTPAVEEEAKRGPPAAGKFTSEENYTPVYDGNLSDLEPLDVNVVTYVTEFYTYRKTMMDYLRSIAEAAPQAREALIVQMIYMQFLMYESARLAILELIEFEPNRAESVTNILCSELVAYGFLQDKYCDDFRGDRLKLRLDDYKRTIPKFCETTMKQKHANWMRAQTTIPELLKRYRTMCEAAGGTPDVSEAR